MTPMPSIALLPLLGLAMAASASGHPDDLTMHDRVIAAARKRQEAIKSANVRLRFTEDITKGGWSALTNAKPQVPKPEANLTFSGVSILVLDTDRVRLDDNNVVIQRFNGTGYQQRVIYSLGNNTQRILYLASEGFETPQGTISDGNQIDGNIVERLLPLWLSLRGTTPMFTKGFLVDASATGQTAQIDGAKCLELLLQRRDATTRLWLDADSKFVVRRLNSEQKEQPSSSIDISYQRDKRFGWLPSGWTQKRYSVSGDVLITIRVDVIEMRINEPLADDQLNPQFPEGTLVQDRRVGKDFRVQSDGTRSEITLAGPPRSSDSWFWRNRWPLGFFGVLVVVALAALAFRVTRFKSA
jgi:hypothetical protein